jgi:hypothetical protein
LRALAQNIAASIRSKTCTEKPRQLFAAGNLAYGYQLMSRDRSIGLIGRLFPELLQQPAAAPAVKPYA